MEVWWAITTDEGGRVRKVVDGVETGDGDGVCVGGGILHPLHWWGNFPIPAALLYQPVSP